MENIDVLYKNSQIDVIVRLGSQDVGFHVRRAVQLCKPLWPCCLPSPFLTEVIHSGLHSFVGSFSTEAASVLDLILLIGKQQQ